MNYIRTEDGIYEIVDETENGYWSIYGDYFKKDIAIKPADTIEELLDDFVIDWLPTKHKDIFAVDKYSKKVIESCIGNNKTNVYGAIWVEGKGLIYVAKMNKKGKLELL